MEKKKKKGKREKFFRNVEILFSFFVIFMKDRILIIFFIELYFCTKIRIQNLLISLVSIFPNRYFPKISARVRFYVRFSRSGRLSSERF